jgi:hypothetical protein
MGELPFVAVVRAGLVLCLFAVLAALSFPARVGPLPAGMHTPILAFELARSTGEVETMFGAPGSADRARWVQAFDRGNTLDFALLVAYGAVLSLYARALRQRTGSRLARAAAWFAFVAPLADALENMRLLAITSSLGGDYQGELEKLVWLTSIKWGALALAFLSLAPGTLARGKSGRVVGTLFVLSFPLTLAALWKRGSFAEAMMHVATLSFVAIFAQAVLEHRHARA